MIHAASKREYGQLARYLEEQTALPMWQLVPSSRQKVVTELVSSLSLRRESVLGALRWLANTDEGSELGKSRNRNKKARERVTLPELVAYLQPRLLGVLGYLDQRLANPHVPVRAKRTLLRSLRIAVELIGPAGVSKVKHKLLATFKTAASLGNSLPGSEVWIL